MLMITDLMLDTVLHLPPLHQHMVPQLLAMTLQLPHMSSQLTPLESLMEVMKKIPCPTSPINVGILDLVGLSLLLILLPVLSPVEKEKDLLMVSCGLFPSICQCFYYLSISFFIAQQTFNQSSDN
jgi:hypothetical protein